MSNLMNKIKLSQISKIQDSRGWFLKVIQGNENLLPDYTGEIYFTSANPGQVKGGHYHCQANEWFCLIKGNATLNLVDTESEEKLEINLSENNPVLIFIPPFIAHAFTNTDQVNEFILFAYTDKYYDPKDTISYEF